MINLGNINITKIYLGDSNISKVYYGEELIFGSGGDDTKQANFPFTDEDWVVNDQGKRWQSNQSLTAMSPFVVDEVSVSFSGGSIFAKPTHMLTYLNLTMQTKIMITAPAKHTIKKITFTTPSGYSFDGMNPTVNNGSFVETNVWEGNTDSLTLSFSQASRLIGMEVEYEELIPKLYTFRYTTTDGNIAKPYVEADVVSNNYYGDYGELVYNVYNNTLPKNFFKYKSSLETIEIPEGIINIPSFSFDNDYSLKSIVIPDSVKTIEDYAFQNCIGLRSVNIPNSVTSIGGSAFFSCANLTSIEIPNSVISLGGSAFSGCTRLTSVTMSNNVSTIGTNAFKNVPEMGELYCSVEWYLKLSSTNVTNLGNLYDWNWNYDDMPNNEIWYKTSDGNIITPRTSPVTNTYENGIGKMVYSYENPSIGSNEFKDCTTLTKIFVPKTVSLFGGLIGGVFQGCSGLTDFKIPENIDWEARNTSVNSTFYGCTSLSKVHLPNNIMAIGSSMFNKCVKLTSVTIPDSVTEIDKSAFASATTLSYVNSTVYGEYNIPSGVTSIANTAFSSNVNLKTLNIPDSVTTIEYAAFSTCSGLTSVRLSNNIETLNGFYRCTNLKNIEIPESVTTIDENAFIYCSGLNNITINGNIETINANAFNGVPSTGTLTCKQSWYNSLSSTNITNLGNVYNWTKVWLNEDLDEDDEADGGEIF